MFSDDFRREALAVSSDPAVVEAARNPQAEEEDGTCWKRCVIADIRFLSAGEAQVRLKFPGKRPTISVSLAVAEVGGFFVEDALPDNLALRSFGFAPENRL